MRIRREEWTKDQNDILKILANKVWLTKKELLSELTIKLPKITPIKALYHATKHLKQTFMYDNRIPLTGEALNTAETMIRDGYDNNQIRQQVHLTHGRLKAIRYYNKLRFTLKRGEYKLVTDSNTGKMVFEHIDKMLTAIQTINKVTRKRAELMRHGNYVTHPATKNVAQNDIKDLYMCAPHIAYKINIINMFAEVLGLKFGTLIKYVDSAKLEQFSVQNILKEIFVQAGLAAEAKKLFNISAKA